MTLKQEGWTGKIVPVLTFKRLGLFLASKVLSHRCGEHAVAGRPMANGDWRDAARAMYTHASTSPWGGDGSRYRARHCASSP